MVKTGQNEVEFATVRADHLHLCKTKLPLIGLNRRTCEQLPADSDIETLLRQIRSRPLRLQRQLRALACLAPL